MYVAVDAEECKNGKLSRGASGKFTTSLQLFFLPPSWDQEKCLDRCCAYFFNGHARRGMKKLQAKKINPNKMNDTFFVMGVTSANFIEDKSSPEIFLSQHRLSKARRDKTAGKWFLSYFQGMVRKKVSSMAR